MERHPGLHAGPLPLRGAGAGAQGPGELQGQGASGGAERMLCECNISTGCATTLGSLPGAGLAPMHTHVQHYSRHPYLPLATPSPTTPRSSLPPPLPLQFLAAGFSGHGMTRTFTCGRVLADMVAGQPLDAAFPPTWLPAEGRFGAATPAVPGPEAAAGAVYR